MRTAIILTLILLCAGSGMAAGTVTVTATAQSILGTNQTVSMSVNLIDPNSTGILRSGGIVLTNFTASSTNGTTVSIANIYGNDVITDGFGNASTSYYLIGVSTVSNGVVASTPVVLQAYQFAGSGTFDLSSTLPFSLGPVSPAGSVLGQNLTFTGTDTATGPWTFGTLTVTTLNVSGTTTLTGTANLAVHSGTIEADVQCTVPGVLDQSCFTNSIALLNNSTLAAIHFKSGTWPITSNITTTKQVTFYCDSEHSTIFQPTAAVTTVLTINNTGGGTGEQYGVYGCGFDMTSTPTATAISLSGISRPHLDRVDIRYPNAITSTGTGITLVNIAQTDFLRTFIRNAGICVLDNGDGGLEHHLQNVTCESPLIAGLKVTRTAAPDVGAVYVAQVRVTNPFARVGGVGYWFTSSVGSTGTPFFLAQIVADSQLGQSVAVSADNATCASAGYCQTSASVGTFLTAAQSPVYSAGQLVTIAGVTGGTCGTAPNGRYPIATVPDSTHFTIAFTGTANQHCGAGTAALSADGLVIENMAGGTISISDSWFANLTAQANKNCATRFKNANNIKLTNNFIQSAWGEVCIEGAVTNIQASNNDFESGAAGSNSWVLDDRLGVATTISGWRVSNNNYNDTNFAILASTAADATGTFVTGSASNNVATGAQFLTRGDGGITQEIVFKNTETGATNAIKSWRVNSVGNLELLNNAHSPLAYFTNAGVFGIVSDITPQAAAGANLGQAALPFASLRIGTAATNNFLFSPAATAAARTVNLWDFGANGPATQNYPGITILTSQYTNSTTGFTNVAGGNTLQFPVLANTTYTAECHLYYQAAATGGLNIEFTGPAAPTNVIYGLDDPSAAATFNSAVATAYGTSLGQAAATNGVNFDAIVSFSLINGANAGTVNLLAKSSAAAQLQIQAGSFCRIQ